MSTRSTSSNLFSPVRDPGSLIRRRNLGEPSSLFDFREVMSIPHNNQGPPPTVPPPQNNNGPPPMVRPNGPAPDLRSMEELCQPSINRRGGPIASIPIQAMDFGLRHHMIQQQNGVSDDSLRLSLFPYSLTHHDTAWYDRLLRNSIHTFDDMMRKFLLKYFPPSMVTKLRNEIMKFRQDPNESLFEAWECYKLSIDRCPNHNMLLVTQIDTFYNGLMLRHQDTINAATEGTFMQKTPEECYDLIENMTAHHNHQDTTTIRDDTFRTISSTTTTESLGSLLSNTVANPRGDVKAITTRSGVAYDGPTIPPTSSLPKEVERKTEATKDKVQTTSTENALLHMLKFASTFKSLLRKFYFRTDFVVVDYDVDPRVPLIIGRPFFRTARALIDVHGEELTLRVNDETITFKVGHTSRYSRNYYDESVKQINVLDVACEVYAQEVLGFSDSSTSGNPTPSDPIIASSSPSFTPFEGGDFILEAIETFLRTSDELSNLDEDYYDTGGDILYLEKLLNEDPSSNFPPMKNDDLKQVDVTMTKPSIEEPPKLELKDLSSHLEYAFYKEPKNYPQNAKRCEDTNLVLNWEKCHFTVKEGIVLGHKISKSGTEVDRAKIDVIAKLPHPTSVKGVRIFLVHARAENLAADHLSRLEYPHEGGLEKKEINETFPFETLGIISSHSDSSTPMGIDFMGPFPSSRGNKYILMAVDYLSKWVEEKALPTNDARVVVKNSKSLYARFGTPRAIISDRSTHFCNDQFAKVMLKYGVTHCLSTAYHPQTSRQVEVSNRGLKRILERTVGKNRASWSDKLDDALWAFHTAFKTPIECTLYKLVYGKACHLPIKLEHKAYWALKHCNFDLKTAVDHQKIQLNELNELRDQAYENSLIYKEKTKKIHDSKIKNRVFNVGDRVLLFNSRLKIFSGKLKTRWTRPFTIAQVFPYGTVGLIQTDGPNFKVNGHRLKHYFEGDIPPMVVLDL
uniref:Reverse transcriptase domain-containing protein n=1 Tax=Tanacetum cinerariifolium TaxID=118510 RepID=A0A6L2J2G8_TANCI|nr:reverse transcriptase domain-containing protein [Tanacetum cinerariifolium]